LFKRIRPLALVASLLAALPALAATTTVDFTQLTPAQVSAATTGNTLTLGGYSFTGDTFAPTANCAVRFGCMRGLDAPAVGHLITVARADGAVFSLDTLDTYVAGTLAGGATDVELRPYDANGVRGTQINMIGVASQNGTRVVIDPLVYPTLSNIRSFEILSGAQMLVDHYTAFALSSVSTVPEASTALMLGTGLGLMVLLGRRRPTR
jgi:hypothetical protein